jgi:hypothetical protein
MSYNAVPTVTTGDTWSAANHNTYIRDNFAAGVPDIFTAAGDIAYATAANAASALAIGSSDSLLTIQGGLPAWGDGLGMSLLSSTTLTSPLTYGETIDITGLSQSYTHLKIMAHILAGTAQNALSVWLNGDTGNNYAHRLDYFQATLSTSCGLTSNDLLYGEAVCPVYNSYPTAIEIDIFGYSQSVLYKNAIANVSAVGGNSSNLFSRRVITSVWRNTDPVTSILFGISPLWAQGTFVAGSNISIYGLK